MVNFEEQLANIKTLTNSLNFLPKINIQGIIEILILTCIIFQLLVWMKNSKAFVILRGVGFILLFYIAAYYLKFTAITFIIQKSTSIALIALIVIFQNEIRYALEHLGGSRWLLKILPDVNKYSRQGSDKVVQEIAKATFAMAKVKTGALMVIEQSDNLENIEKTGIAIDGKVSSGLLINIFEKNTPLHDGAVLIVGDIVKAATCYLPLSENMSISKSYGTRHRAALGISEISDSQVIVVSEETGNVSLVVSGKINHVKDEKELMSVLIDNKYYNHNQEKKSVAARIKGFFSYEESTK